MPELARAHDQVADYYRQRIHGGVYTDAEGFPSVREIVTAWKVSPNTVRRALSLLKEEGLIDYSQGRQAVVLDSAKGPALRE